MKKVSNDIQKGFIEGFDFSKNKAKDEKDKIINIKMDSNTKIVNLSEGRSKLNLNNIV